MNDLPPGYVHQPYPKWIYHPDGRSKVIDTPAEQEDGWYDTSTEAAEDAGPKKDKDDKKDEKKSKSKE